MLPANTSTPEAIWSAITGLALLINAGLLWLAAHDLLDLHRKKRNGAKRIAAWTAVGVKGALTLVQLIFCGIGVFAATQPPPNPGRPVTPVGLVLSTGLIAAAVILAGLGVFMHARRMQLLDYLEHEAARDAQHAEVMESVVGARVEAATAAVKAEAAAVSAEVAAEHSKGAQIEATAAHNSAQEVLGRIDRDMVRQAHDKEEREA